MGDSITDGWIRQAPEFFKGRPYLIVALADKPPRKCWFAFARMSLIFIRR